MTYPYDSQEPVRFSRQWWAKGTRNFIWVALVTMLIWVYADLEKTDSRDLSVKVRLSTGSSGDITLASPGEIEVKFTVRGSNSSIERYSRELSDQGWLVPVDVAQRGVRLGENTLQTAEDILDPLTGISGRGLAIVAIDPRFIKISLARPQEEFRPTLVLYTGAGKDLALLDKTDLARREIKLALRLQGSRDALAKFGRELTDSNSELRFDLTPLGVGKHDLNLAADVLARMDAITSRELTVVSAMPPTAAVELDRVLFVPDVEVRFRSTGATIGEAVVRPPTMGLYVAKSRWDEVLRAQPKPVMETVTVDLANAATDKPLTVPIDPYIATVPIKPQQPTVDVDVKISQLTGEKTLTIPVRLLTPQAWAEDGTWDHFVLKRKDPSDWRKKVTFRGAKKDVERLQAEDVDAYVVMNDNDKLPTTSWLSRDVELRLPKDLQLQVVGDKPKVDFRFDARVAPPAP